MKLSKNFSLYEFTRSQTASRRDIDNQPGAYEIANLKALCRQVLQPLRDALGPISISSGYRCPKLNAAVGGVATSFHTRGQAADIVPAAGNCTLMDIGRWIQENCEFEELIWEFGGWIHVAYAPDPQGQVLKYWREGGKTKHVLYVFPPTELVPVVD